MRFKIKNLEDFKAIEEIIFALEFSSEPKYIEFEIEFDNCIYKYGIQKNFDKYYFISYN